MFGPLMNTKRCMPLALSDLLDNVHILSSPTRSIATIAQELNAEEGAIINPIICSVGSQPVLALMAGDKACDADKIGQVLNLVGNVDMLSHDEINQLTGGSVDELYPLELAQRLPTIIDASLKRFSVLYSRAGSNHCLIATTYSEIKALTHGTISYGVATPTWHPSQDHTATAS